MTSAASRLLREVRDISSQQIPVVFGEPEEADILHWRGMILGPPHTPYALGMFHFDLKFPQDYPNSAPKVLITTTSGGQVRFNPNLYASGKVCLSILGTWRAEHSGEQWSAVQSSQSILLSIQSLMNDAPYHNEPSFEADDGSGDVQRYNEKISHESVRVAVCEVMEDTVENRAVSSNGTSAAFSTTRKQLFFMYYQVYLGIVKAAIEKKELRDGAAFKMMPFECSSNGMHGNYQWTKLQARLDKIHAQLMLEVQDWRAQGTQQTALRKRGADSAVNSCVDYLAQQQERIDHEAPDGVSVGVDEANVCVWVATIFGPAAGFTVPPSAALVVRPLLPRRRKASSGLGAALRTSEECPSRPGPAETLWDGGMFQVELVFPPDFPDAPPYVHFLTSMFHPHISPLGVPYLRHLIMWNHLEPKEKSVSSLLTALVGLLASDPSPEPATHLNLEAASLAFSRSDDDKKEYKKQVKKRVQRSMDG